LKPNWYRAQLSSQLKQKRQKCLLRTLRKRKNAADAEYFAFASLASVADANLSSTNSLIERDPKFVMQPYIKHLPEKTFIHEV